MAIYSFITLAQARGQLAARLNDLSQRLYLADELNRYITEALRTYNALTSLWMADYTFTVVPPAGSIWTALGAISGYPRQKTVTDTDIYKLIQYHLLEPATGGTWTGTTQFAISDLSSALQARRDEILQLTGCNPSQLFLPTVPNTRRTVLADNIMEVRRARFVPAPGQGSPVTLWRDDELAWEYWSTNYLQNQPSPGQQPGTQPQSYSVMSEPPQSLDTDYPTSVPGTLDLIAQLSGAALVPPATTVLGLPDDWTWVAKWGALSDLLGSGSERGDEFRAAYALQRYKDGIQLMLKAPWLTLAQIQGATCDTVSMSEMDAYAAEWDSIPNPPVCIVEGGTDIVAISPVPTSGGPVSALLRVVGNAPVPLADGDFIQCSRDVIDVILDYAQHIATFKKGGKAFQDTLPLAKNFVLSAMATNERIANLGIYRDILLEEGNRQDEQLPRIPVES